MGRTEAERVLTRALAFVQSAPHENCPDHWGDCNEARALVPMLIDEVTRLRAERDLLAAEVRLRRAYSPIYSSNADYDALMTAEAAVDAAGCLTEGESR